MTQKELNLLQALSIKREREELTHEEKRTYEELCCAYEVYEEERYIKNRRAEV